jgi:hypothetical protein
MKNGEEDGPLDVELKAASLQQLLDHSLTPGLLPKPLEDKGRPDVPIGDREELSFGVRREHEDGLGESRAREEKGVELARLLEQIESPQCGDDALPWSPVLPAVFDDLEVGASTGLLGAEEHGALVFETP